MTAVKPDGLFQSNNEQENDPTHFNDLDMSPHKPDIIKYIRVMKGFIGSRLHLVGGMLKPVTIELKSSSSDVPKKYVFLKRSRS